MAYYLIKYLDDQANKKKGEFEGRTKSEAVENSHISPEHILSVNLAIHFGSNELALDVQELIISEIRALAQSGQAISRGLARIVARSGLAKKTTLGTADEGKTISKSLADIGMSRAVVAVVAAGESASRLDEALSNSLAYIQSQKKIRERVKAPFTQGVIIVLLAVLMIMFLPLIIAPALETLTAGELEIETNIMTDLLLFIERNNGFIWLVLLLIAGLITLLRGYIWQIAHKAPVLAGLKEFFILKRSILLLMILRPLFESGIPLGRALVIIKSSMSSSTDTIAMESLVAKMALGQSLSRAVVDKKYWSPILYNSFASFEKSILEAQLELIDTVTQALLSRLSIITARISNQASIIGKVLAFFALLMLIIGYYFPSLTANVA